jgi:hypothetical protein
MGTGISDKMDDITGEEIRFAGNGMKERVCRRQKGERI